jgi:ribonuclease-3
MTETADLERRIEHTFQDKALLDLALTHRSSTIDSAVTAPELTNERLEFLGDRVLGLCIAELLYSHFSDEPEGSLARRLSSLVSRETLFEVAEQLTLTSYIKVGGSEADLEHRTASTDWRDLYRCGHRGSQMFYHSVLAAVNGSRSDGS